MNEQTPAELESSDKGVKAYVHVYILQPTCTCICICGCVHICIHMHACCPDGGDRGSWGMVGVKHLCGSKPRSGQLQWPMFKVNGGLRWLFISRLFRPCWTPLANSHRPSSSSSPSLHILSIHRDLSWKCLSTGIHFVQCEAPPRAHRHVHMQQTQAFVH